MLSTSVIQCIKYGKMKNGTRFNVLDGNKYVYAYHNRVISECEEKQLGNLAFMRVSEFLLYLLSTNFKISNHDFFEEGHYGHNHIW